jgi:hypothetical protein
VHQSAAESTDYGTVKTIAKTILVLLLTLGVLFGQTTVVSAAFSPAKVRNCKKCPCEQSAKPSCCIEKSGPSSARQTPALPQLETRLIQPAILLVSVLISPASERSAVRFSDSRNLSRRTVSEVPLFLRHRAILI